jgi:hypothetical protein
MTMEYPYEKDPNLNGIDPKIFREESVAFLYMTRGNDIYHEFVTYLLRQCRLFLKFSCVVVQNSWKPAVEDLFEIALESRCNWIHLMDTDIGLPYHTTGRLIANDHDICASPLYFYDPGNNEIHLNVHYQPSLMREYTPRMPEGGCEEVLTTAFGSVVIRKRVLEAFKQANWSFCEWTPDIDEAYKDCSPDTIFFLKARALGFKVWMDWRIPIGTHHKWCRFDTTLAEKLYVQRWWDVTFGPDEKAKLTTTPEGRQKLQSAIQRHYADGAIGRDAASCNETNQSKAQGEAPQADSSPVREEPPPVHDEGGGPVVPSPENVCSNVENK